MLNDASAAVFWHYLVAPTRSEEAPSFTATALRVGTLMGAFLALDWWIGNVSHLPRESYTRSSISVEVLRNFLHPKTGLPLLAIVTVGFVRPVWFRWDELDHDKVLRSFVGLVTVVLAWVFSTYDYNFFFDQSHLADRILLCVLSGLVLWRPVFVLPFVLLVVAIAWQFYFPIGGYSVAQPFLLVRVLILFVAMFFVLAVSRRRNAIDFVFCALLLLAATYFNAGLGKISLPLFE